MNLFSENWVLGNIIFLFLAFENSDKKTHIVVLHVRYLWCPTLNLVCSFFVACKWCRALITQLKQTCWLMRSLNLSLEHQKKIRKVGSRRKSSSASATYIDFVEIMTHEWHLIKCLRSSRRCWLAPLCRGTWLNYGWDILTC